MMVLSNIFLVLPVATSIIFEQWMYLFFAGGLLIFSPLFHWYRIVDQESAYYGIFRKLDWLFAAGGSFYMYYYVSENLSGEIAWLLYLLISSVIAFFWYGWLIGNYKKLHPWFHVIGAMLSTSLLLLVHLF